MIFPKHIIDKALSAVDAPNEVEWASRGFGALHHYLTDDELWLLQVWDERYRAGGVPMIHNHFWNTDTKVLFGSLANRKFHVSYKVRGHFGGPSHYEILVPMGHSVRIAGHLKAVNLIQQPVESFNAIHNDEYSIDWNETYCTDAANGTVTLTHHQPNPGSNRAFSYVAFNKEWVNRKSLIVPGSEVLEVFEGAINRARSCGII